MTETTEKEADFIPLDSGAAEPAPAPPELTIGPQPVQAPVVPEPKPGGSGREVPNSIAGIRRIDF